MCTVAHRKGFVDVQAWDGTSQVDRPGLINLARQPSRRTPCSCLYVSWDEGGRRSCRDACCTKPPAGVLAACSSAPMQGLPGSGPTYCWSRAQSQTLRGQPPCLAGVMLWLGPRQAGV